MDENEYESREDYLNHKFEEYDSRKEELESEITSLNDALTDSEENGIEQEESDKIQQRLDECESELRVIENRENYYAISWIEEELKETDDSSSDDDIFRLLLTDADSDGSADSNMEPFPVVEEEEDIIVENIEESDTGWPSKLRQDEMREQYEKQFETDQDEESQEEQQEKHKDNPTWNAFFDKER